MMVEEVGEAGYAVLSRDEGRQVSEEDAREGMTAFAGTAALSRYSPAYPQG